MKACVLPTSLENPQNIPSSPVLCLVLEGVTAMCQKSVRTLPRLPGITEQTQRSTLATCFLAAKFAEGAPGLAFPRFLPILDAARALTDGQCREGSRVSALLSGHFPPLSPMGGAGTTAPLSAVLTPRPRMHGTLTQPETSVCNTTRYSRQKYVCETRGDRSTMGSWGPDYGGFLQHCELLLYVVPWQCVCLGAGAARLAVGWVEKSAYLP